MRLKPTKTTIGVLGGLIGLLVVVYGTIYWFQNQSIGQEGKVLEVKLKEVQDGQRIASRAEAARAALEQDRAQLRYLEAQVSDQAYVPTLLRQMEELAVSTRNRVIGVRPAPVTEAPKIQQRRDPEAQAKGDAKGKDGEEPAAAPEPYIKFPIQVSLVGQYGTVQAFVQRLNSFPKILGVEELQIRPHRPNSTEQKMGDVNFLDVELKVTAFILKPDAARPTVTASAAIPGV